MAVRDNISKGKTSKSASGYVFVKKAPDKTRIELGFKPRYLAVIRFNSIHTDTASVKGTSVYDADYDETHYVAASGSGVVKRAFRENGNGRIWSIDDTGFTLSGNNIDENIYYFAMKGE